MPTETPESKPSPSQRSERFCFAGKQLKPVWVWIEVRVVQIKQKTTVMSFVVTFAVRNS